MARIAALDTILAGRHLSTAYRILTTALQWPAGEPPFASGHVGTQEPLPGTVADYESGLAPDSLIEVTGTGWSAVPSDEWVAAVAADDGDTSYIVHTTTPAGNVHYAVAGSVPPDAVNISVTVRARLRDVVALGNRLDGYRLRMQPPNEGATWQAVNPGDLPGDQSWVTRGYTWATNPHTGAAWTPEEANGANIGLGTVFLENPVALRCTRLQKIIAYQRTIAADPFYEETFDPDAWTDASALVSGYRYTQSLEAQTDALSLSVPLYWLASDLERVFAPMRVIVVQERYGGAGEDSGWVNRCWCLSTGYGETWSAEQGQRQWTVNALDAMLLAGLNTIASESGSAVYQADTPKIGAAAQEADRYQLALVGDASDAWEYGVITSKRDATRGHKGWSTAVSAGHLVDSNAAFTDDLVGEIVTAVKDGENVPAIITARNSATDLTLLTDIFAEVKVPYYIGAVQPNWADRPGPQVWCHNVPDETEPIPLRVAGDALQAVFGEGILRLGKTYARTDPRETGGGDATKDFSRGLDFADAVTDPATDIPDVRGYLYRFAHPQTTDRGALAVPSDLGEGVSQLADPPVPGQVTVAGDLTGLPEKLTLVLLDGTGARYHANGLAPDGGNTVISLTNPAATVPTGAALRYGEANRAVDLVWRWLLEAGYQVADAAAPLFANPPDTPSIGSSLTGGETEIEDLVIPPLAFVETDDISRREALEKLRREAAVIPSWIIRADADGKVVTDNIRQLFDLAGPDPAVIPLIAVGDVQSDRTDLNVYTRVVARGLARQVTDFTQLRPLTIEDLFTRVVEPAYPLTHQSNPDTPPVEWPDYVFNFSLLFDRGAPVVTLNGWTMRPWGWYYEPERSETGKAQARELMQQWVEAPLLEIEFYGEVTIAALDLHADCPWYMARDWEDDWGGGRQNDDVLAQAEGAPPYPMPGWNSWQTLIAAHADPQTLAVDYWDAEQEDWIRLASEILCPVDIGKPIRIEAADFDTRGEITTSKLRLVCSSPFFAEYSASGDWINDPYGMVIGVWLRQLKIWGSPEIRGVATLGTTAPFDTAAWQAIYANMRRRTYTVPDVADWASTQALVDALALEWLYEVTRNLAPLTVSAARPDARLGDTVRFALPSGEARVWGDASEQLSLLRIRGMNLGNTDDGCLYWTLTDTDGTRTLSLYKDSGKTELVLQGCRDGDGEISLAPQNGSRLSGEAAVAYSGDDTDAANYCGMPTYLVVGAEHGGEAGAPALSRFTLVDYARPYFEE